MGIGQWSFVIGHWSAVISDNVVKKPKTAIVIPTSLRRRISSISYYYTFRFTKRSHAALGMTIRIFYEGIKDDRIAKICYSMVGKTLAGALLRLNRSN
jgi:hypothetical protein